MGGRWVRWKLSTRKEEGAEKVAGCWAGAAFQLNTTSSDISWGELAQNIV